MAVIGVFIHPWHTYSQDILSGIARFAAQQKDWETYLPWPGDCRPVLPRMHLDGLIVRIGGPYDVPASFGRHLPRVIIANTDDPAATVDIAWDNVGIGRQAGEHLLSLGHQRLIAIGEFTRWPYQRQRADGLAQAAAAGGARVQAIDLKKIVPRSLQKVLRSLSKPTGLFAATDAIGGQVLQTARRLGLNVPEELAVVAAGDYEIYCELASPPLSSVAFPATEVGYSAAFRMHELLTTGKRHPPQSISPRYVTVRRSSEMLALDDPLVTQALRLIRTSAITGLTVEQLRRSVPLSRRSLELRFKRAVGRTIEAEILRVRLDAAKRMLVDNDLPIASVADRAGFSSAQRLSTVFAREVGQSPTAFRNASRQPKMSLNRA